MAIGSGRSNFTQFTTPSKYVASTYKRFYDRYQTEFSNFQTSIHGIQDQAELNMFASIMFTRLMFLYFLQHKNFLDNDSHYLSNHLNIIQNCGVNTGDNFYHDFLQRFFLEGLNTQIHATDFAVAGRVPFLDIDLFKENQIENKNRSIKIANEAFENLFTFFDSYSWQIDDQASSAENVITPEIFVYIFERQINQKQMGAYYTQDDITAYIAKSTIIPFLFNAVEIKCPGTFQSNGFDWQLLKDNPDRYIYPAIKKGVEIVLPSDIEEGLHDVSRRNNWNSLASEAYALPTETWREVIARRQHYQQIRMKLEADTPLSIDDLVIYNLNICHFAEDVIGRCEDHKLLQAFHESILKISVFDPTCGTGAFLIAALDILEPLYTACLDQLEQMESKDTPGGQPRHYISKHCNRRNSILKSIITSNIYGVDIMEEAVEICKLRLFLKLLAPIERTEEIEPLPNLNGNIITGNVLLGNSEIMNNGGFDVIIGNPPYIESERALHYSQGANFMTSTTGNLYAFIMERCTNLLVAGGRSGMIVPASATSTDGYLPLQQILLEQSSLYIASFSDQRGKLFDIPHPRLCIICYKKHLGLQRVFSTPYIKPEWKLRESLFQRLNFTEVTKQVTRGIIPRYGSTIESRLHDKLHSQSRNLGDYLCKTGRHKLFITRKLSWFVQVTPFIPRILDEQGKIRKPSELKILLFPSRTIADIAFVAINSNLFYWYLTTGSDCRNLNMREVLGLPIHIDGMIPSIQKELQKLAHLLSDELLVHSEMRSMNFKDTGELTIQCIFPGKSKPIIDEIDRVLSQHYGFTDEELDFIINYDVKYRRRKSQE